MIDNYMKDSGSIFVKYFYIIQYQGKINKETSKNIFRGSLNKEKGSY